MRPNVISIAGFDPSGGAGLLADVKTFEAHGVQGFGVCSSLTFQNDTEFQKVNWVSTHDILNQLDLLLRKFNIEWIKIGLIRNLETIEKIVQWLDENKYKTKIIWDPIMKASAGYEFHKDLDEERISDICGKSFLVTPNLEEIKLLFPGLDPLQCAEDLSYNCHVLLKSASVENAEVTDILLKDGKKEYLEGTLIKTDKHGTGCVLSASILSHLALGKNIYDACSQAKSYVEKFRMSNETLLGYHNYEQVYV